MRRRTVPWLGLMLALPAVLHAQASGGAYELRRAGLSSGAGRSIGGAFELQGSLFRFDAHAAATGGNYRLSGGLLVETSGGSPMPGYIFHNDFE